MDIPREPVIFFKATTARAGPNDCVMIPRTGAKLDWEVDLAVVVGRTARHVAREQATDFVAGYVLHNDYSERAFQLDRGGQWVKGKSADTFAPLGPFLATRDEMPDTGALEMWLDVSDFMTLLPGDVISTGTPAGVALGTAAHACRPETGRRSGARRRGARPLATESDRLRMTRHVLTVDLRDDPAAIDAYTAHHRRVWPEVVRSLQRVGILEMEIYMLGRRLVMVVDTDGADVRRCFAAHESSGPRVAEWEGLMKALQQPPPGGEPGEWWARMEPVFRLELQQDTSVAANSAPR